VEAETGACGTGAISTALVCAAKHNLPFPIAIIPPSCQLLSVDCKLDTSGNIDSLFLIGPAIFIDTFELFFDNEQGVLNV
jgi:diaminopimelate epimerase